MPGTESQPSFLGWISFRRNQVVSMDGSHEQELEDLDLFQCHVGERFSDLVSPTQPANDSDSNQPTATLTTEPLLSISWLRKLVDVLLCCEAEFKAFLIIGRDPCQMTKTTLDRLFPELMERFVKVLDICNAVSSGLDNVRQCQKLAEIAVNALRQTPIGDGQIKRSKKALTSMLTAFTLEEMDHTSGSHYKATERAWSFGRRGWGNSHSKGGGVGVGPVGSFRSFSMIVGKNWSATKQIQAMCLNLVAPRGGGEATGLALAVYIMSVVLVFTMWALVAAVPRQERNGLVSLSHFQVPRQVGWAQGLIALQERIGEEWKRKEKTAAAGLMEEMQRLEKLGHGLLEVFGGTGELRYPLEEEREAEVVGMVAEMGEVCRRMEEGLVPLQQQIREVFHRIVRSRSEMLELLENAGKVSQPTV